MLSKKNWEETQIKFANWWNHKNTGRPLMSIIVKKEGTDILLPEELIYKNRDDKYLNVEQMVARYRYYCSTHEFIAESFPNMSVDFGPGSLAAYLGSDIIFNEDTVWFTEIINGDSWDEYGDISYDEHNVWWIRHQEIAQKASELIGDDFLLAIPDIMENIDVLQSLRGASNLIFDLMDEPETIKKLIGQIDDIYFKYYDKFYNIMKDSKGGSCYTVFQVYGEGKTGKIQCDFSAMISPQQFREFVLESLRKQAKQLDYVLYHLDGPDAIRHLDAIMEIDEIDALQWTSGDHGPDGTLEDWYIIYDKARAAGKSLWVKVYSGDINDWIRGVDKLVERYGSHSLFLHFPEMNQTDADKLMAHANKYWCDVQGTFAM